jgi:hypothetical protein
MNHPVINILYGATPAEFVSGFSLAESIERLRDATVRSMFQSLNRQSAAGTVTERRVALRRIIPLVGNSFSPYFVGHFETRRSAVILTGAFRMSWVTRIFMTLWFGFVLFWTVVALFIATTQGGTWTWWFPVAGLAMIGAGVGMVHVGKWFARNDASWLAAVIQNALAK